MAKIELNENDVKELQRLQRKGLSYGEALVKMGKATLKVVDMKNETPKVAKKKNAKVDPTKEFLMDYVSAHLRNLTTSDDEENKITAMFVEGTKKIDFSINGESYSFTLTKKRPIK